MPEDRSLDEFAADATDDGERADAEQDDAEPDDDADAAADADTGAPATNADPPTATPVVPTATWTTDAAACDRCGEPVSRRWFDEDALVCADCKEW
jgi:hypothetical protein